MSRKPIDMAHVLGWFALGTIVFLAIGLSAVLSSIFFANITPASKPWLVYLFMGLTEVAMMLWLIAFFLMHHHSFHKSVALVMACFHGLASFVVAGYELDLLIFGGDANNHGASLTIVGVVLLGIFALDLLAVFVEVIARYFEIPGHEFRLRADVRDVPQHAYTNENISHYEEPAQLPQRTRASENKSQEEEKGPGFVQKAKDYLSGKPMQLEHTRKPGRRGADYVVPKQEQLNSFTTKVSTDAKIPE